MFSNKYYFSLKLFWEHGFKENPKVESETWEDFVTIFFMPIFSAGFVFFFKSHCEKLNLSTCYQFPAKILQSISSLPDIKDCDKILSCFRWECRPRWVVGGVTTTPSSSAGGHRTQHFDHPHHRRRGDGLAHQAEENNQHWFCLYIMSNTRGHKVSVCYVCSSL